MVAQVTNTVSQDTNNSLKKLEKTQEPRKRNRKKSKKQKAEEEAARRQNTEKQDIDNDLKDVEFEYVVQPMDAERLKTLDGMANLQDDVLNQFSDIFRYFQKGKEEDEALDNEPTATDNKTTGEGEIDDNDSDTENKDQALSKKKMKQLTRLSVAELKQLVSKPEAVEWWDVNADDPKLLVQLKSYRNTVPVPVHWSQKRKYLQNKRGIEKPPFELPEFIKDTGIMEMRDAVKEKEDAAGLKSKMKEKVAPKMGKLDVDYQKLHDAFFRFQTKPNFALHGEMYYEGKENETKVQEKNPGQLSEELKQALNMPPLAPPPWLINMQRYGPPPNYPTLKISGLNAPIPEGAQWGYHPGGWGRPPVDEFNRPLYGDVFGVSEEHNRPQMPIEPVDRTLFGELESDEELEESEEEEEEEEEEEPKEEEEEALKEGLVTPSGMASVSTVASGLETPDVIELRKEVRRHGDEEGTKQLYQVLPEVDKKISGLMGSQHGYDLQNVDKPVIAPTSGRMATTSKRKLGDNVDVAIDPSELESGLDESTLRAKYEAQVKSKLPGGGAADSEDLSDMYAEHASRQAKKKKIAQDSKGKQKEKEFKF
ncbi:hypothetical protein BCR42DRAFT_333185 [Absidia repens]|uniref:PSP proline-rich domain-containing protein n=1 Tax=Absidia repens TaxID=90262 RepID=A0A1X2I8R3_9FUNG|nr:hypothetical protein BCR42DRAFT_333185 [Absidia repens]